MTIGIVGLGLIGGALAKSIKARTEHHVLGIAKSNETMTMARMSGAIDGTLTSDALKSCDIVMTALNPLATLKWAEENAERLRGTVLVDMCGVKREICAPLARLAEAHGFKYVGGHPMAGKEVGGFINASAELFTGASMIFTPDERTDIKTLDMLKALFLGMGFGRITFSTPEEHDRTIAYTSQLAHIISSAYIKSPTAQGHIGFSAGSFNDLSRVARLDEDLWTELFMANSDHLVRELELMIRNLGEYLAALKSGDAEELRALLKHGRECKQTAGGK